MGNGSDALLMLESIVAGPNSPCPYFFRLVLYRVYKIYNIR